MNSFRKKSSPLLKTDIKGRLEFILWDKQGPSIQKDWLT